MPLVNSIIPKRINVLGVFRLSFSILLTALCLPALSQDNSPYSRYGLGDIVPSTNIITRAMGGISAGYYDVYGYSINYNNPASYSNFFTLKEPTSKKIAVGRAILDIGLNVESRTLREPANVGKFTASNALFSHVQVGVPLRPNWGLSFGLRPVARISYKMVTRERLIDPISGLPIDSALTLNEGDGGAYLATMGTGFAFKLGHKQSLSLGVNGGYLFGKKDISIRRSIFNDSLLYNSGNYETRTTYGNLFANAGIQYQVGLNKSVVLSIGAYGNWKQTLNASQDIIRETYFFDENTGNVRLDSVYESTNNKGSIIYPSSYTVGFTAERLATPEKGGWLFGLDYSKTNWDEYRFYGQADPTVQSKWELRAGAQIRPRQKGNSMWSNTAYRAGLFIGQDYIKINEKLPLFGATLGLGIPLPLSRQSPNQVSIINLAFEFIKRGNNDNLLKENLFRISFGFSLSDFWFAKRKYE